MSTNCPTPPPLRSVMNKQLQLPEYSRRILHSSMLTTLSVWSGWYNELYGGLVRASTVLFTSIMYWRHPVDGWRRKLDMFVTNCSIMFQMSHTATFLPTPAAKYVYFGFISCTIACYFTARHFGRRRIPDFHRSSKWHTAVHFFGNVANLILFDALGKNHLGW